MSIQVGFYETRGLKAAKKNLMVRPKMRTLQRSSEIAAMLERRCTLTKTDIMAVLNALSTVLGDELLEGNHVQLEGIGTFSPSVTGEIQPDKNGRPLLKSAKVRNVSFRPSAELKHRMKGATFTTQNVTPGYSRADITDAEMLDSIDAMLQKTSYFTTADFAKQLGLTASTARRNLKALVERGVIVNNGTRAKAIYCKPQ